MSRITQAWAVDTADMAADSITGTLVLGALTAELCVAQSSGTLESLVEGQSFPVTPVLSEALGIPVVYSMDLESGGLLQLVLSETHLAGRSGQWLRVTWSRQEDAYAVNYAPLITYESTNNEPASMDGFGQIGMTVQSDCTSSRSIVHGNAMWLDEDQRRHEVSFPADQELGSDLVFSHEMAWLPLSGAISWEARVDQERRSLTSEDAAELRVTDTVARWPVMVQGPDWSGKTLTTIAP